MSSASPGKLTDAQARNLVIKSLRKARAAFRSSDTAGEAFEREIDRLIKRKTRINSNSLVTLAERYNAYQQKANQVQNSLQDAYAVVSNF